MNAKLYSDSDPLISSP